MGANIIRVLAGAAIVAGMAISTVSAQSGDIFPDEALGVDLFTIPDKYQKTYIDVGGGVLTLAPYHGSAKQKTNVYPFINAEYKGRWFANPFNGAGVYLANSKKFNLSTSVTYNPGRKQADTPYDMPEFDLDPGIALKTSGRIRFKYFALGGAARLPVMGDVRGLRANAIAATLIPIGDQISIVPSVGASYESSKRLTRIYGLNKAQSVAAGLPELSFTDGVSGYDLSLAGYWRSDDKTIQVLGGVTYRHLAGDIKDSPLAPKDTSILAGLGVAKRY